MSPLSPLQQEKEATESGGPSRPWTWRRAQGRGWDGGAACSLDLRPHLDRKLEPQLQAKTELGPSGSQLVVRWPGLRSLLLQKLSFPWGRRMWWGCGISWAIYLCSPEEMIYKIDVIRFKIRDMDSGTETKLNLRAVSISPQDLDPNTECFVQLYVIFNKFSFFSV